MLRKLSLVAALLVLLMSVVTRETWNGVVLGASAAEVRVRCGTPVVDYDDGSARMLRYPDMVVVLRDDRVFSITLRGDRFGLYARACLAFGAPAEGGRPTWRAGEVSAGLCGDELTVWSSTRGEAVGR